MRTYNNLHKYSFTLCFFCAMVFTTSCQTAEPLLNVELQTFHNSYHSENEYFTTNDTSYAIPKLEKGESHFYQDIDFSYLFKDSEKGFDFSAVNQNPIKKIKLVAGDVSDEQHQFKIGIIDFNNNGIFNEKAIDQFFIAPYQSKMTLIENTNPWIDTIGELNLFKINNQAYKLISIEPDGNSISMKKFPFSTSNKQVNIDAILNINEVFELVDLEDNPIQSTKLFNNRPLYLEFWFNACSGCIKSLNICKLWNQKILTWLA